jgi:hypothetical protein
MDQPADNLALRVRDENVRELVAEQRCERRRQWLRWIVGFSLGLVGGYLVVRVAGWMVGR